METIHFFCNLLMIMADVLDIVLIPDYLYAEMTPDRV